MVYWESGYVPFSVVRWSSASDGTLGLLGALLKARIAKAKEGYARTIP